MYGERLHTLSRAYKNAERNNSTFKEAQHSLAKYRAQLNYVNGLAGGLTVLDAIIAEQEKAWQDNILRTLESEIMQGLSFVYPTDGYSVSLSTRILRGKVHVEGTVHSYYTQNIDGDVADTQGRLFQQIVSFAALVAVMTILGVNTIYVDEAFSGAAEANLVKINKLLQYYNERGLNIILIAQSTRMAIGIDANTLILTRSLDNKTTIHQSGGAE